ncbi:hypothetical protein L218DRAFT_967352 [Marasmius fiardii PR-910]|nr:hypothetical protein L218DRAFT_967352 [Marasmius fiardii PR-910]
MLDCWNLDPQLRPAAPDIVTRVAAHGNFKTGGVVAPAPEWDTSTLNQEWKDVKYPFLNTEALI